MKRMIEGEENRIGEMIRVIEEKCRDGVDKVNRILRHYY